MEIEVNKSFLEYLPEIFSKSVTDGQSDLGIFLEGFEQEFNKLLSSIEDIPNLFDLDSLRQKYERLEENKDLYEERKQAFQYLKYLAGWIGLPLREDKGLVWNVDFFKKAISLYSKRGTLEGLEEMIYAWLDGDIVRDQKIVSDFISPNTLMSESSAAFRIEKDANKGIATIGLDTYIGIPPENFFSVYIRSIPTEPRLKTLKGYIEFYEAARFIVDLERPAHTYYRLLIKGNSMQLAPCLEISELEKSHLHCARIGITTLILDINKPIEISNNIL